MPELAESRIVDHVWRPPHDGSAKRAPRLERPCAYLNCQRPRAEHERTIQ